MSSHSDSSSEDELTKKQQEEAKKAQKKEKKSKKRQSEAAEEPAPSKKAKKEAIPEPEVTGRLKDSDGNEMFEFGNLRYASISTFKGKEYLNIREYYVDKNSGKMMPSRKGISLTKGQWSNLKDLIPELDKKF